MLKGYFTREVFRLEIKFVGAYKREQSWYTHPLFHRVESAQHNHYVDYYKGEASKENCLVIFQNLVQEVQVAATYHIKTSDMSTLFNPHLLGGGGGGGGDHYLDNSNNVDNDNNLPSEHTIFISR
jgi:hypothetical protein